jgi:D-alanyl-lipoteichoic acid acyltransferase DltB (MBOAT superfamily)
MLFQSQLYVLVFLPAATLVYYVVARSPVLRQWVLICASLFFYGWWDPRFIPLLVGQVVVTWSLAKSHEQTKWRAPLFGGIVFNLASLGIFKYLEFFLTSIEATGVSFPHVHVILPIGISFFSFQLLSYLADRLRGQAPIYPIRQFALFVMLFPHLIAGPIVRHNELIPQFCTDPRRPGLWKRVSAGLVIFTIGFGKKVLLADHLAVIVDPLFEKILSDNLNFGEAWTALLAFSLQLFLDFSAYTEMAIGTALMFGLVLPENFRRPYLATDLRDFWRRWHISLSKFLRDYLYIPLGGSRRGRPRYVVSTLVTMGLCGLWHGAGWTYVAWGLWHGIGLLLCHSWQKFKRPLPAAVGWAVTMLFVLVGWAIFRAPNFGTAGSLLFSLIGGFGFAGRLSDIALLTVAALASVLIPSAHEINDRDLRPLPAYALGAAVLAIICVLEVGRQAPIPFIYFQF